MQNRSKFPQFTATIKMMIQNMKTKIIWIKFLENFQCYQNIFIEISNKCKENAKKSNLICNFDKSLPHSILWKNKSIQKYKFPIVCLFSSLITWSLCIMTHSECISLIFFSEYSLLKSVYCPCNMFFDAYVRQWMKHRVKNMNYRRKKRMRNARNNLIRYHLI